MLDTSIKQALNLYEQKERERRHVERLEEEKRIKDRYALMKKQQKGNKKLAQRKSTANLILVEQDSSKNAKNSDAKKETPAESPIPEETNEEDKTNHAEEAKSAKSKADKTGDDKTSIRSGGPPETLTLDQQMELEISALDMKYPEPNFKEDKHIKMWGIIPPITKMDNNLALIAANCEKLSLSTNQIEKIQNLTTFKKLKILNLARNNIKNLAGLEAVSDTLEELYCSYNSIEKLKPIVNLKKLKKFALACNLVRDWNEVSKLAELHELVELNMFGNVLVQRMEEEGTWRKQVRNLLKGLRKLDNGVLFGED